MREWKEYNNQNPSFDFPNEKQKFYQYSFVGPLSMSKGYDLSTEIEPRLKDEMNDDGERDPIFIYRGELLLNLIQQYFQKSCNFRSKPIGGNRRYMFHALDSGSVWTETSRKLQTKR